LRAHHRQLTARQADLEAQIAALTSALAAMGGTAAAPGVRRRRRGRRAGGAPRAGSLKDVILKVLRQSKGPLSPAQISARVVRAGYKTKAANLPNMVSNALSQTRGVKKAGRGQYHA
ncbi:MAG: hypothetical protein ACYSVY_14540, partial [Planctomycetota bacterium]